MSAFLEFRGISKVFPGVRALSDVSFGIECGRVHGLLCARVEMGQSA